MTRPKNLKGEGAICKKLGLFASQGENINVFEKGVASAQAMNTKLALNFIFLHKKYKLNKNKHRLDQFDQD